MLKTCIQVRPKGETGWFVLGIIGESFLLENLISELETHKEHYEDGGIVEIQLQDYTEEALASMPEHDGW